MGQIPFLSSKTVECSVLDGGSVRGKIFALSVSVLRLFSSSISGVHASVALKFSEIANYAMHFQYSATSLWMID